MSTESCYLIDLVFPDSHIYDPNRANRSIIAPLFGARFLGNAPDTLNGVNVVIRVFDERASGPYDPTKHQPNILCISFMTTGANRAYQLSKLARHAKSHSGGPIKIIHGGIHATSLYLEALKHCDIVVRGEITPKSQQELLEFALNMGVGYKAVLRLKKPPCVIEHRPADWSWVANRKNYLLPYTIQTSVGCPFGCDFCSVTQVAGAGMRPVAMECLEAELKTLPTGVVVAVVDDNFLQGIQPKHIEHCLNVAKMMHAMGFRWMAEITVKTLSDARRKLAKEHPDFDLVEFFAAHGCIGFFFGIETVVDAGLKKSIRIDDTTNLIHHCQACGIGVLGAFVLGVGRDETPDYAKRVVDYAIETAKLDFAQFSINTPMPGARNFIDGVRNRTILNYDWPLYDAEHCVMRHPTMKPEELEAAHRMCYELFYGWKSVFERSLWPLLSLSPGAVKRLRYSALSNIALHFSNDRRQKRNRLAIPGAVIDQPDQSVIDQIMELGDQDSLFNIRDATGDQDETFEIRYVTS